MTKTTEPRLFTLVRVRDESGVSGVGRVLDGALFHTGQVVICWRTDIGAAKHGHSSLGVYPSWEAFEFIHIKSHPDNATEIEWLPGGVSAAARGVLTDAAQDALEDPVGAHEREPFVRIHGAAIARLSASLK